MNWFGFILLGRTLFFDRIALVVGALAGLFWLLVGDAIALPFWAGNDGDARASLSGLGTA